MSLAVGPLSWGRAHHLRHAVARPGSVAEAAAALAGPLPALGYGRGRSYGDSCLNDGGLLVETARLDRFIAFDRASGRLEAEAGVTISEVLAQQVDPLAGESGRSAGSLERLAAPPEAGFLVSLIDPDGPGPAAELLRSGSLTV